MKLYETIKSIAHDLRDIKQIAESQAAKRQGMLSDWVSVARDGYPDREPGTNSSVDVLIGMALNTVGGGRVYVIGWGYYSHACDSWYIACGENFPRQYRVTREKVTHYLAVPKYARD